MGIKLLRIETVSLDQDILDRFRRSNAIGSQWIVKYPITAGHHVRSCNVVCVLDGGADITIDMAKSNAPSLLQHRRCGFFEVTLYEGEVLQAEPFDIFAQFGYIDVGKAASAVSVYGPISGRHSSERVKPNHLDARQKSLGQCGHENGRAPLVGTELDNVTDRETRQKKLKKQKNVGQACVSDDRAAPCQCAGAVKIWIDRDPRPKIGKRKADPTLVTFVQISAFANRLF